MVLAKPRVSCRSSHPARSLSPWPAVVAAVALAVAGAVGGWSGVTGARAEPSSATAAAERLVSAYPDFLAGHDGNWLHWKDGTRMALDDGRGAKPPEVLLASPDLEDMFHWPYPAGSPATPPAFAADPGRARHQPFFDKMYGVCAKGETDKTLVDIVWLPSKAAQRLKVSRVNGVAGHLEAVSRELDKLPASFDRYLFPAAGTYHCRPIAGTSRPSAHGAGIAIDIGLQQAHYWRWSKPDAQGRYAYRNSIPAEIVAIFEKHGFVWGGRWYHYDTMHFEYRPEFFVRPKPTSAPPSSPSSGLSSRPVE